MRLNNYKRAQKSFKTKKYGPEKLLENDHEDKDD